MPNIATVLKSEIGRLARKESRGEVAALKQASSRYRSDIAALKRQLEVLERKVKQLARGAASPKAEKPKSEEEESGPHRRFSAKGLAKHRERLGISAADFAKLVGVSSLSIYKWESGAARPRARYIESIARVRDLSRAEALAKLGRSESSDKPNNEPVTAKAKAAPAHKSAMKKAAVKEPAKKATLRPPAKKAKRAP